MSIVLASFSAAPRSNTPSTSTSAVTHQVSSDSCQNPPPPTADTSQVTSTPSTSSQIPPSFFSCCSPGDIHPLNIMQCSGLPIFPVGDFLWSDIISSTCSTRPLPPPVEFIARVTSTSFISQPTSYHITTIQMCTPSTTYWSHYMTHPPVLDDVCTSTPEQQLNRLHTSFPSFREEVFERLDKLE